jgi:hypothetical protein
MFFPHYKPELKINLILKLNYYLTISFFFFCLTVNGQTDSSSWAQKPEVSFSGYLDIFHAYDFNEPKTNYRQPFLYSFNRHNEFNLNLGLIKVSAKHLKYRANIAIQAGTYVMDNYANEETALRHISEGNAGLSLNKKNNLWLDVGIFGSTIGFESAISKDSWTLTRSLLAENSPYYLSGAKLTYNPNEHWEMAALVCNGWQRIKKVSGSSIPAFCSQIKYIKGDKLTFNWSTFIGTDDPDTTRRMRYFNNFYVQSQLSKKFGLIAGFDIGAQQLKKESASYSVWYSPVIIFRYMWNDKWTSALRAEHYQDKDGVLINTGTLNGFKTSGLSLNFDYSPFKNIVWRIEGRWLTSSDKIFIRQNENIKDNFAMVSSIAVQF